MANRQETTKTMSEEMQHIISQARALVEATSGEVDERIKSARAALVDGLESTRGGYGAIEDRILDKVQAADELIHIKPYYAIGGTFVAGLLLGWFMSRK